jgi:hypothetical protein
VACVPLVCVGVMVPCFFFVLADAKGAMLSYHIGSRKAFLGAPRAAQDVWCFMESLITSRFGLDGGVVRYARELSGLRCTVWLSKGTSKVGGWTRELLRAR